MRYQPDHKAQTRREIVSTASTLFRKDGVVATGVVGLMKGVGLTQGGFYAHFESKEALVREAAAAAMLETSTGLAKVAHDAGGGVPGLRAVIDAYLSGRHRERVERGCAFAAIGAELAREPAATREAVMDAAGNLVALIERLLPDGTADARRVARSVFCLMSGTLQMARLSADEAEAADILAAGNRSALLLCGVGPEPA